MQQEIYSRESGFKIPMRFKGEKTTTPHKRNQSYADIVSKATVIEDSRRGSTSLSPMKASSTTNHLLTNKMAE